MTSIMSALPIYPIITSFLSLNFSSLPCGMCTSSYIEAVLRTLLSLWPHLMIMFITLLDPVAMVIYLLI